MNETVWIIDHCFTPRSATLLCRTEKAVAVRAGTRVLLLKPEDVHDTEVDAVLHRIDKVATQFSQLQREWARLVKQLIALVPTEGTAHDES